jgi:hypothetical protein
MKRIFRMLILGRMFTCTISRMMMMMMVKKVLKVHHLHRLLLLLSPKIHLLQLFDLFVAL